MKLFRCALIFTAAMLAFFVVVTKLRAFTVYNAPTTCANYPSPYGIAPMPGPQDYPLYCVQTAPTGAATPTATPGWFIWQGGNVGWAAAPSPLPTNTPTATPTPA